MNNESGCSGCLGIALLIVAVTFFSGGILTVPLIVLIIVMNAKRRKDHEDTR